MFKFLGRQILRPNAVTNDGVLVCTDRTVPAKLRRHLYADRHENQERRVIRRSLLPHDRVLELGAGAGVVTALCCSIVGDQQVCAVEANEGLKPLIVRNLELNHFAPQLIFKMIGGGEIEKFNVSPRFLSSSRFDRSRQAASLDPSVVEVESISLKQILRDVRPTYLVMDIEGSEVDLLDPCPELDSVQRICLEFHPHIIGEELCTRIADRLISLGFEQRLDLSEGIVVFFERPHACQAA